MLSIDAAGLQLQIKPISSQFEEPGGPYFEWIEVQINLAAPGIQAEGRWSVMPLELREFQQQVQAMYTRLQPGQSAKLASVEPGFELTLHMLDLGHITGDWRFQPVRPDSGACITGDCVFDQSLLPEIMQGIDSLLDILKS